MGVNTKGAEVVEVPMPADTSDIFRDPSQRPNRGSGGGNSGGGIGGSGDPPVRPTTYVGDLFHITKSTHTMEGRLEHPNLPGLSALAAHASPDTQLLPREYGAQQNASQIAGTVPVYHPDRPVISYRTDMPTGNMARAWGPADAPDGPKEVGRWTGPTSDFFRSENVPLSGKEVSEKFALPNANPPTELSTIHPDPGTIIEASVPISGVSRQYKLSSILSRWFKWKNSLD